MIVASMQTASGEPGWQMITQNDHAHFAAGLLGMWFRDGLPDHPYRESLLFAARQHDNGWLEADSAPFCDDTGRPHDFMSIPRPTRQEIWQRCTSRYSDRDPYGNLLIVQHALHLHRSHLEDPDWQELIDPWIQRKNELMEVTEIEETALQDDYRWIDLTDFLSLVACNLWRDPIERHGYRARLSGPQSRVFMLQLDPFPLAGATTFRIPCRHIPQRTYTGTVDLATTLATATWQEMLVQVAPWTEI